MKLSKQKLNSDQPKTLSKRNDKKSINIKWNSKLFFQVGLIVALLVVYFVMQTEFKIVKDKIAVNDTSYFEDPPMIFYTVDEPYKAPKRKIIIKQKAVQPNILDKVIEVDNNSSSETDISKVDESKAIDENIPKKLPNIAKSIPLRNELNIFGVEEVPIYPGCDNLITNEEKRNCMADKIKRFIQKRFKTDRFSDEGLKGKQIIRVKFYIDENGEIADVIAKANDVRLENEAIRVISNLPKMSPARQGDKIVKVQYMIPIVFKID